MWLIWLIRLPDKKVLYSKKKKKKKKKKQVLYLKMLDMMNKASFGKCLVCMTSQHLYDISVFRQQTEYI